MPLAELVKPNFWTARSGLLIVKVLDSLKKLVVPNKEEPVLICNLEFGAAVPIPTFPVERS